MISSPICFLFFPIDLCPISFAKLKKGKFKCPNYWGNLGNKKIMSYAKD
jgi:hypothetical protein